MDSPGFAVAARERTLRVLVPVSRLRFEGAAPTFRYDAVTCYMQVSAPAGGHAADRGKPMLGVYEVFDVLSGKLTLPYTVTRK